MQVDSCRMKRRKEASCASRFLYDITKERSFDFCSINKSFACMLAGILDRNTAHGKFCGEANDTFLY